jgi:eukaryotic-like serine/threonine-protein kinase
VVELERTINAEQATTLAGMADSMGAEPGDEQTEALAPGTRLGRYVIVGVLGQGGMGVVYAGHDPELDRRVALKLLARAGSGDAARVRTLREAQAMARLQHPNAVAIYDVGVDDDRVWLAMELVQGVTLRQWLAQADHGWRAGLEVMRAAARGLAAAHAAGLVHRDVKPENIMIGDDGRVRVMDFGLARAGESLAITQPDLGRSDTSVLGSELTVAGSLLGTPTYMAPEGLVGGPTDARADIFSWAVTCWEVVYGERPFAGETLEELRKVVLAGKRRAPPAGGGLPAGLRRVLERALEADRRRRYASFAEILAALDAALRGQRWRVAGLAAGGLALALATGFAAQVMQTRATAERCAASGAAIAEVWGEAAATTVEAAFVATGQVGAAETFARTRPWLDAYANEWAAARESLCLAEVHGASAVDDGLACLEERRASFEVLVGEVLAKAEPGTLTRAVISAARLPAVRMCLDAGWLARAPRRPDDPGLRARIGETRVAIGKAAALDRGGLYAQAGEQAAAAVREAEAIGWLPLVVEARLQAAGVHVARGEFAAAEAMLEQVIWKAEAIGYDLMVAEATHHLTYAVGVGLARPLEGVRWGRLGVAALTRIGAEESLESTNVYAALAIVLETHGELAEARALKEKLLAVRERHLGADHPSVANALNMVGVAQMHHGEFEASLRSHERALAIRLAKLGPAHFEVAASRLNLGLVHQARGDAAACVAAMREAQQSFVASAGPTHPEVASALANMAACEVDLDDLASARTHLQAALTIREAVFGEDHPMVGQIHAGLGDILRAQGDPRAALGEYTEALRCIEAVHGGEHPSVAELQQHIAAAHREAGDSTAALVWIERADRLRTGREIDARVAAAIEAELLRLLWESGDEASRGRVRGRVDAAVTELRTFTPFGPHDPLIELRRWFDEHAAELRR